MDEPRSTTNLTDADLIRRVAEGETRALELLYDRSAWFVYANAFRMLHDRSRAQDIVSQVYLSFWQWQSSYPGVWWWRHPAGYRAERSALTWRLLTLTSSLAIHSFPDLFYLPESRFADDLDVPRDVRKEEVRQATLRVLVAEAMDWLPASQRHVFELRAVQGLSAQLVADRLEKSPNAVNALMHRAMRNLQYSIGLEPEEITQIVAPSEEELERLRLAKETLITEVEDFLRRSRSRSQTIPEPADLPQPSVAEISSYLQNALGPRLTALSVGVSDAREIVSWASGDLQPDADIAQRLHNVYAIVQLLLQVETPQAVRAWFLGMNPELDDRAPALMLADEPEVVAEAARNFAAAG
jgi:RNA polymerase sigma factor (sigma-70 family)